MDWEKELEDKFGSLLFTGSEHGFLRMAELKEFIQSLLSSERQRIKDKAEFELSQLVEETYKNEGRREERRRLKNEIEKMKKESKIPRQSLKFYDCPERGLVVNRQFVDREFKEAVDDVFSDILKIFRRIR